MTEEAGFIGWEDALVLTPDERQEIARVVISAISRVSAISRGADELVIAYALGRIAAEASEDAGAPAIDLKATALRAITHSIGLARRAGASWNEIASALPNPQEWED